LGAVHSQRITAAPLPSYLPDDNPIAYLWKKPKQRATHKKYGKEFAALTGSVEQALVFEP
jgi:transposase